jgi:hypothetical protein
VVVLAIVVPALLLWYGVSSKPDYWQPPDPKRPEVREAAERFEAAMTAQVPKATVPPTAAPGQPPLTPGTPPAADRPEWTVEVTQEQLNSWLAVRVAEWGVKRRIDARVLDRLAHSVVNVDLEGVEVAVPVEKAGVASIVRLRYRPVPGGDKRVRLVLQGAQAGMVPVPINTVLDNIAAYVPRGQRDEIENLRGKVQSLDLLIPLEDGRKVGVVDLALLPGKFVLTCRVQAG